MLKVLVLFLLENIFNYLAMLKFELKKKLKMRNICRSSCTTYLTLKVDSDDERFGASYTEFTQ